MSGAAFVERVEGPGLTSQATSRPQRTTGETRMSGAILCRAGRICLLPGARCEVTQLAQAMHRAGVEENAMSDFMIESPHTKDECLHALDETLASGQEILAQYE